MTTTSIARSATTVGLAVAAVFAASASAGAATPQPSQPSPGTHILYQDVVLPIWDHRTSTTRQVTVMQDM